MNQRLSARSNSATRLLPYLPQTQNADDVAAVFATNDHLRQHRNNGPDRQQSGKEEGMVIVDDLTHRQNYQRLMILQISAPTDKLAGHLA